MGGSFAKPPKWTTTSPYRYLWNRKYVSNPSPYKLIIQCWIWKSWKKQWPRPSCNFSTEIVTKGEQILQNSSPTPRSSKGTVVKWVVRAWSMACAQPVAVQSIVLKFNVTGICCWFGFGWWMMFYFVWFGLFLLLIVLGFGWCFGLDEFLL